LENYRYYYSPPDLKTRYIDATPNYMHNINGSASKLAQTYHQDKALASSVRIVYVIRNPIDRMKSSWQHFQPEGWIPHTQPGDNMEKYMSRQLDAASDCSPEKEIANIKTKQGISTQNDTDIWGVQWMSLDCHNAPKGNPTLVQYGGGDAFFLQHWLMLGFGVHQFCILSFEELTTKDQRAMGRLGQCLGAPIPLGQLPYQNKKEHHWVKTLGHPPSSNTNVSAAFQDKFHRYQLKWLCVLGRLLDQEGLRDWDEFASSTSGWMPNRSACEDVLTHVDTVDPSNVKAT